MKLKRSYGARELARMADPEGVSLGAELDEAIGKAEIAGGAWFIYGPSKNGKTSMAMILAKALAKHRKVAYDSVEEGINKSLRMAVERHGLVEAGHNFVLLNREFFEDLVYRLKHSRTVRVVCPHNF